MKVSAFRAGVFLLLFLVEIHPCHAGGDDATRLAAQIDRHISGRWAGENVEPAPAASDAEFMRRVYLDIGGKIPPVSELREFLDDPSPDRRRKLVDQLLAGPNYIVHFTTVWRTAMIPEVGSDIQVRLLVPSFEAWLREKLTTNVGYDGIIREILTVPLNEQASNPFGGLSEPTPTSFYRAKQLKPENLAACVSRAFLGVRIECAQCHDHPFDRWKRNDFWSLAAFFGGIERIGSSELGIFGGVRERTDRREIEIPDTGEIVQAAYLDGGQPKWRFKIGPRATLADWVVSADNPYFARAAVNRMWAHFCGVGLVDPLDDFGENNPPSHPELLDELADAFAAHDFDLKFLIRAIAISHTYGLSSNQTNKRQEDRRLFARVHLRRLTAEQMFASLAQATGRYEPFSVRNQFDFSSTSARSEVLETFSSDTPPSEDPYISILQALAMMNGALTADATSLDKSTTLAAVLEFPLAETADRVEALYLAALSRKPTDKELVRMVKYVDVGGPRGDPKRALADLFWALLNSSEFMFNH